jgi:hypothetical protein
MAGKDLWLFHYGYGGIIDGVPQTTGKGSPGDPDKEQPQFDVVVKTCMPANLTGNLFMDYFDEYKNLLMLEDGRDRISQAHFNTILKIC